MTDPRMLIPRKGAKAALILLIWALLPSAFPARAEFGTPSPVAVDGYAGHLMEPFISCDGKVLLFNNLNEPSENTDLHWAERVSAARFRYRGKVEGANTPALEGVPTMDCQNNLYWVSPRSYDKTLSTIYRGTFAQGRVTNVELVEGVSRKTAGIVNFDVEVSPSGNELYIVDGLFNALGGPNSADIAYAVRANSGFRRPEDASSLFAKINTSALEYAMAISHDGLELFFTRMSGALFWRKLTIEHSVRASTTAQWEPSRPIASIDGFVEGPTITADGKTLYFHKKVDGMFRLFMVTRP